MFRVDFNNEIIKETRSHYMKQFTLSNIKSSTFLKVSYQWKTSPTVPNFRFSFIEVFPFCIVIDPHMRISQLGPRLESLFDTESCVNGKHISDVFTILRPDILHIEWEKVCVFRFLFFFTFAVQFSVSKLWKVRCIRHGELHSIKTRTKQSDHEDCSKGTKWECRYIFIGQFRKNQVKRTNEIHSIVA